MNIDDVIDYWFSSRIKKQWFASTPALDAEIKNKFEEIWVQAMHGKLNHWQATAEGCLALVIVLDQLPLNMFRNEAKSFSSERQAVATAKHAIEKNFTDQLDAERVGFIFMPLMHSEELTEQDLSVAMFEKYKLTQTLRFAKHHRDIIRRYSRFPHRNKILGRKNTAEEITYLQSKEAFTG